ncbi:hypothetical protein EES41_39685 (plasmid) [Streptomyces sp. ADI95-16]|nr:hypothetical protein EES41_39685 [Streptomyces sp. ADI95-16]
MSRRSSIVRPSSRGDEVPNRESQNRPDLRIVARVRAWLADLRELFEPTQHDQNPAGGEPAYQPNKPLFRALTTLGNLKRRANATVRGLLEASGKPVDTSYEPWRDLINEIRALRLDSYGIADRLRSLQVGR